MSVLSGRLVGSGPLRTCTDPSLKRAFADLYGSHTYGPGPLQISILRTLTEHYGSRWYGRVRITTKVSSFVEAAFSPVSFVVRVLFSPFSSFVGVLFSPFSSFVCVVVSAVLSAPCFYACHPMVPCSEDPMIRRTWMRRCIFLSHVGHLVGRLLGPRVDHLVGSPVGSRVGRLVGAVSFCCFMSAVLSAVFSGHASAILSAVHCRTLVCMTHAAGCIGAPVGARSGRIFGYGERS